MIDYNNFNCLTIVTLVVGKFVNVIRDSHSKSKLKQKTRHVGSNRVAVKLYGGFFNDF